MAAVFGPSQDGESENRHDNPHGLSELSRKAFFFGYFLLGQQKKVPRPRGRNGFYRISKAKAFAFGESLFFAGAKKSDQKKAPSPTVRSSHRGAAAIFGLAIHGSVRKRPPSTAAALRVFETLGVRTEIKSNSRVG